jgi:hypothetical protein
LFFYSYQFYYFSPHVVAEMVEMVGLSLGRERNSWGRHQVILVPELLWTAAGMSM